jgi:flagellar biosynthetic protein FliQ
LKGPNVVDSSLIELARQALLTALLLSAPILGVGVLVGLLTGLLQAVTQIHDQSLSFAPKLLAVLAALILLLPWFMQFLSQYAARSFSLTGF